MSGLTFSYIYSKRKSTLTTRHDYRITELTVSTFVLTVMLLTAKNVLFCSFLQLL